jgi:ankyrin repeat protein
MAVEAHDVDMCALLLKRSQTLAASQLAHRTKSGDTPLHTAVRHAHEPIVQLLIECGADPTVQCAGVTTHDATPTEGMDEATDDGRR